MSRMSHQATTSNEAAHKHEGRHEGRQSLFRISRDRQQGKSKSRVAPTPRMPAAASSEMQKVSDAAFRSNHSYTLLLSKHHSSLLRVQLDRPNLLSSKTDDRSAKGSRPSAKGRRAMNQSLALGMTSRRPCQVVGECTSMDKGIRSR